MLKHVEKFSVPLFQNYYFFPQRPPLSKIEAFCLAKIQAGFLHCYGEKNGRNLKHRFRKGKRMFTQPQKDDMGELLRV